VASIEDHAGNPRRVNGPDIGMEQLNVAVMLQIDGFRVKTQRVYFKAKQ